MNSADKILRIAQGGKTITPEMSAADRVMAYAMPEVEPQTQPQLQQLQPLPKNNGLWGGFKDFAGSNAGRTLLGGLGTALAVGLTGGNAKDALGYGVIGAGNTVGVLNKNKQYQDALQEKQLERQRKIDEAEQNRQFLQDQQTRLFEHQENLAKLKDGTDFNSIDSVRKEFNALTSDYRKVGDAFSRIKASYENPTPAGDLSMIFNYMKALDPGSVVRESEFANAENARAWFDNTNVPTFVRLAYEKAVKGNKLLPEQRKDFYDMAVKLFEAQKNSFDNHSQFYKGLAQRRGWDENDVISDPYVFGGNGSTDTMVYYKNKYNLE